MPHRPQTQARPLTRAGWRRHGQVLPKEANDTIKAHAAAHGGRRISRQCVADEHYVPTVLAVHGLDAEVPPPPAAVLRASAGCACASHRTLKCMRARSVPQHCVVSSRPVASPMGSPWAGKPEVHFPASAVCALTRCTAGKRKRLRGSSGFGGQKQLMDASRVATDMQPSLAAACTSHSQLCSGRY